MMRPHSSSEMSPRSARVIEQLQFENEHLATTVQMLTNANSSLLEIVRNTNSFSNRRHNSDIHLAVVNQLNKMVDASQKLALISSTGSSNDLHESYPAFFSSELSIMSCELCDWINVLLGVHLDPSSWFA